MEENNWKKYYIWRNDIGKNIGKNIIYGSIQDDNKVRYVYVPETETSRVYKIHKVLFRSFRNHIIKQTNIP